MQPDFERYRKALFCQQPDRVPLFGIPTGEVMNKFMGRSVKTQQDVIDFRAAAGFDYCNGGVHVDFFAGKDAGGPGARTWGGQDFDWAPQHKGLITSWKDFEAHPWPRLEDVDYAPLLKMSKMVPEGMQIMAGLGHIFTDAWRLMGFETFAFALRDDPELVGAIFEKIGSIALAVNAQIVTMPKVGCLKFGDDLAFASGPLIANKAFRKYLFPWYKKLGDLAHQYDLPFALHTDGNMHDLIADLSACGINGLDPIEQKCNDIRVLKQQYGDKVCLQGNIGLPYPTAWGTPEDNAAEALELLRDVGPGGGFCLGSSKGWPDYVPIENFRAVVDTLMKYGKYPLNIPEEEIKELRRRSALRTKSFAVPDQAPARP